MDLAQGNLEDQINGSKNNLEFIYIKNFVQQILKALSNMQQHMIAHRDIKPENILIKNQVYLLGDLDDIKFKGNKTQEKSLVFGTLQFAAPELLMALDNNIQYKQYNAYKADLFSFGLCLLYMCTKQKLDYDIRKKLSKQEFNLYVKQQCKSIKKFYIREKQYDENKIRILCKIIKACLEIDPFKRPDIKQMYKMLVQNQFIDDENYERICKSYIKEQSNQEINQDLNNTQTNYSPDSRSNTLPGQIRCDSRSTNQISLSQIYNNSPNQNPSNLTQQTQYFGPITNSPNFVYNSANQQQYHFNNNNNYSNVTLVDKQFRSYCGEKSIIQFTNHLNKESLKEFQEQPLEGKQQLCFIIAMLLIIAFIIAGTVCLLVGQSCPSELYYSPLNRSCVQNCPDNYYADYHENQCKKCDNNCLKCTSESDCYQCQTNYILINGACKKNSNNQKEEQQKNIGVQIIDNMYLANKISSDDLQLLILIIQHRNQNFIEEIGYSVSCSAQNKKSFLSSVSNLLGIMTENSVEYLLKLELEKINYICKFNYQEVQRLLEIGEFLQLSIQEQKLQQKKKRESIRKLANDKIQLYHERLKMQKLQQEGVESDKNIKQQNQVQENQQQQKNEDEQQQQQLKQQFIYSQILVIDKQVKYKNEGENTEENQENKLEQGLIRESQKQKVEIEQKNNKNEDIQKQIENQKGLEASIENDKNTQQDIISISSIDQELQNSKTSVKTLGNRDQICSLCLDNNVQIVYPCYHSYCQDCSNQWIIGKNQQSCPACRKDFGKIYGSLSQFQKDVFYLQAKQDIQDNIKGYKEDLMKIFKSKNKLIPFKSFSQSGNILYLQASQISNNQ
ncbi:Protein kinase-like domain [Pseudocohnilembus persalinus]|uniref:non-specific serine/threonine protein kinase n=1 Tax=Pseudocohnilembus persalinus TaxID=266149 RepID=A0A0V0QYY9_PSEPJ|nr:Protein kinase-like domain [Pseudocohnilembus persalinus]|eukprot:KRX07264.1 Protein kinase-like domain [Pseudocohnilembus persalinus]